MEVIRYLVLGGDQILVTTASRKLRTPPNAIENASLLVALIIGMCSGSQISKFPTVGLWTPTTGLEMALQAVD
jgi:hypothetical protein